MAQATLDDDDLFGEAADELRADVHEHLDTAEEDLPDPTAIWTVESDNVLGVLNTLRTALDIDDARDHLRQAKKWYALGDRADAFDADDTLGERIDTLERTIADVEAVSEDVAATASTLPGLREQLGEYADEDAPAATAD